MPEVAADRSHEKGTAVMPPGSFSAAVRRKYRRIVGFAAIPILALAAGAVLAPSASGATAPAPMTTQAWHNDIASLATPTTGCYTAAYPSLVWRGTGCVAAPDKLFAPKIGAGVSGSTGSGSVVPAIATRTTGTRPDTVGNGTDYSAKVAGVLTSATGSFTTVSGVTSEESDGDPNSYSLQLNSAPFTTPVCDDIAGCVGWEQFVFSNPGDSPGEIFIQFWLLNYGTSCPPGWGLYSDDCYRNGAAAEVPDQPITNLAGLTVTGIDSPTVDTATLQTPGGAYSASTVDSVLDLSADWNTVEFMVGGDGGGSQADFNAGATITVQTVTHNGTTNAPTCVSEGFTGETNNLTLEGTAAYTPGASPSIRSNQSDIISSPASCAAAHGEGDTHLETFGGTFYDFQAEGTFTLAQNSNVTVQTNQVSGAPEGWSGAAVNSAVATQMGPDTVAVCASDSDLVVDGAVTELASGQTLDLASGDAIVRTGNQYVVTDPQGDSVTAGLNSSLGAPYLNVNVGLGTYPEPVSGLLANAPGTDNELETSTGAIIDTPVDLTTLYDVYGDSWRVPASQSLVAVCGGQLQNADPTAPFWADELPVSLENQSQAVCAKDGVQNATLLEACTLDVAVLGNSAAAEYVGEPAPVDVGFSEDTDPGSSPSPTPSPSGSPKS
jgi:hypothetical protein